MSFSSPPAYSTLEARVNALFPEQTSQAASSRRGRMLVNLVLSVALLAALFSLRKTIAVLKPPPDPPPLDFKLVEERFGEIEVHGSTRAEVERLLGPPTQRNVRDPEIRERELRLTNGGKDDFWVPYPRVWDRWTDPQDAEKWVLIYFAGNKVYFSRKNGF